jgi:hypothetical protein
MRFRDSRYSGKRFMVWLDTPTWEKFEEFFTHFDKAVAGIIRQLVAQATIEDFPETRRAYLRRHASTRRRQS